MSLLKGAETFKSMHSVTNPSGGNAGVYSRMQTVVKVPNVILRIGCPKHLAPVVALHDRYQTLKRRRVFSHANGCKGAECYPANRLSQASCTCCRNSAMTVADPGDRASSRFFMSYTNSIGEWFGIISDQGSCCTSRRARCVAAAIFGHALSCWKAHHLPVEEMTVTRGESVKCLGNSLLYPAETSCDREL